MAIRPVMKGEKGIDRRRGAAQPRELMPEETVTLEVFRYRPEEEDHPQYQKYQVPFRKDWVVLDALNYIKDQIDGTLSYRWSCRMGVCGSCGMMVNGDPKLTCATFLRDYYPNPIRVDPLNYFPVIRDLIINMEDFLHKLDEVQPWLIPEEEKAVEEGEYLQAPAELARYKQFSIVYQLHALLRSLSGVRSESRVSGTCSHRSGPALQPGLARRRGQGAG